MATKRPTSLRIRMYNVGFGDCFLLTFHYGAGKPRHVLIDFGSNEMPDGAGSLKDLAADIKGECGADGLAAVVLSHRHRDHIKGFDPAVAGEVIAGLHPEVILRPWTESPKADDADARLGLVDQRFKLGLSHAEDLAGKVVTAIGEARPRSLRAGLSAFAARQLKNADAVHLLDRLSEQDRGRYLSAGVDPETADALPGVKITVLGPPLPEQWPAVRRERADDPEYWLGMAERLPLALESEDPPDLPPGPDAWLVNELYRTGLHSAYRVVLALDRALNNTSLILLIEAAGRRLLFGGDAQIENWSYALTGPGRSDALIAKLAALDIYKVGHHGSRNATPKLSLLPLWQTPGAAKVPVALLSTKQGVYDDEHPVPADALVKALVHPPLSLISTDDLAPGVTFVDHPLPGV